MVDLHCHVLPGVDDGPRTLGESVALCRAASRDGTRTLVATPHVNGDYPDVTASMIRERAMMVSRAVRAAGIEITIRAGAEVALSRVGELSDEALGRLTLGGGAYLLIELPWTSAAAGPMSALRALAARGYRIVLAHPERAPMLQRDEARVAELVRSGVLCCLDARSLGEHADRRARSTAWRLLAGGLAHAIASDCHDAMRRPPALASALERAGLTPAQIDYFARQAPAAILGGENLTPAPEVEAPRRRRWLRRTG